MFLGGLEAVSKRTERLHEEEVPSTKNRSHLGEFEQLLANLIVAARGGDLSPYALAGLEVASSKTCLPHARKLQIAIIAMGLSSSDSSKSVKELTGEAAAALENVDQLPDTATGRPSSSSGTGRMSRRARRSMRAAAEAQP